MKKTTLVLFFCLSVSVVFPQTGVNLDKGLENGVQYLVGRLPPGAMVAVVGFSSDYDALSRYIMEELSGYIVNDGTLILVDRRNLKQIDDELMFQMSGEVSEDSAQALGKKLGAHTIITGSIEALGNQYRLRVRAVDVETSAVRGIYSINVIPDSLLAALTRVPRVVPGGSPGADLAAVPPAPAARPGPGDKSADAVPAPGGSRVPAAGGEGQPQAPPSGKAPAKPGEPADRAQELVTGPRETPLPGGTPRQNPGPGGGTGPGTAPGSPPTDKAPSSAKQDEWKDKLIYFGVSIFTQNTAYEISDELKQGLEFASSDDFTDNGTSFYFAVQFTSFFAIQTEFMFRSDEVVYRDPVTAQVRSFVSSTLDIPILAEVTVRPGIFSIQGFGGPYFSVPYEPVCYSISTPDGPVRTTVTTESGMGYMFGFHLGIKIGPGVLFGEYRYSADVYSPVADIPGLGFITLYNRTSGGFFLGYEIGFLNRNG